jgi:hypothetical protein
MNILTIRLPLLCSLLVIIAGAYSTQSYAAYCSLRDPVSAINMLYPNASHHRSITREVDRNSRDAVSKRLPFTLLFNELGKHTLYVVMDKKMPLGFIHARSELSDFGLIEIVWAINADMTIKDSYFQRCRNKKCRDAVFIAEIKSLINNKTFDELNTLIKQESSQDSALNEPSDFTKTNARLTQAIIKSALKTIAVTETVWAEDISSARREKLIYSQFGNKKNISITAMPPLQSHEKITFNMVHPTTIRAYQVASSKRTLATIVYAQWDQYGYSGAFNWLFSNDGTVLNIQPNQPWPNNEIAHEFAQTLGKNISDKSQCNTATELAGSKLFYLSQQH